MEWKKNIISVGKAIIIIIVTIFLQSLGFWSFNLPFAAPWLTYDYTLWGLFLASFLLYSWSVYLPFVVVFQLIAKKFHINNLLKQITLGIVLALIGIIILYMINIKDKINLELSLILIILFGGAFIGGSFYYLFYENNE